MALFVVTNSKRTRSRYYSRVSSGLHLLKRKMSPIQRLQDEDEAKTTTSSLKDSLQQQQHAPTGSRGGGDTTASTRIGVEQTTNMDVRIDTNLDEGKPEINSNGFDPDISKIVEHFFFNTTKTKTPFKTIN